MALIRLLHAEFTDLFYPGKGWQAARRLSQRRAGTQQQCPKAVFCRKLHAALIGADAWGDQS